MEMNGAWNQVTITHEVGTKSSNSEFSFATMFATLSSNSLSRLVLKLTDPEDLKSYSDHSGAMRGMEREEKKALWCNSGGVSKEMNPFVEI